MRRLKSLIDEYKATEIPGDLEQMVNKTITRFKHRRRNKIFIRFAAGAAAVVVLFAGAVNLSPPTAGAMSEIPVLSGLVRLVTIKNLTFKNETHEAGIKVPQIEGLENSALKKSLNEKYLDENIALYNKFIEEMGDGESSPQKIALFKNYTVKTDTGGLFVVEQIKTEIAASGTESVTYDNIDLKNQIIITLPSLFKNDSYVEVISENIKTQMREKTNQDEGIMYFIEGEGVVAGGFNRIAAEQSFYINADAQLVIVFNEYEVAPGCMGIVEFVIPTEVFQDILVSNSYIK